MAGDGHILVRVVRGDEPLAISFLVSLGIMGALWLYLAWAPSLSDFWQPWFRGGRLFTICYAVAAVHNSCAGSGLAVRLLCRAYVLLLIALGTYLSVGYYGPGGFLYPLVCIMVVFLVKPSY